MLLGMLSRHSSTFTGGGETKYFEFQSSIRRLYPNLDDDRTLRRLIDFVVNVIRTGYNPAKSADTMVSDSGLSDQQTEAMLVEAKRHRDYGAIFRAVFDFLTQIEGKARWLEKTPTHIFHVEEIVKNIPDALFVEIVRDPRDIMASRKTRRATVWTDRYKPEQRATKHLLISYDPFWDSLAWKSSIRAGRIAHKRHRDRILSIRYEDVVVDPKTQIQKVCEFLKMDFEPELLNVHRLNPADWEKREESKGITAASVGRWRQVLTPAEIALGQWLLAAEMKRFDYSSIAVPSGHKIRVPFLVCRSAAELFVRFFRRWRLGGLPFAASLLANYRRRLGKLIWRRESG